MTSLPEITLWALAVALFPSLGIIWIASRWAGGGGEIAYATTRMLVQLLAVGFLLVIILKSESPLTGLAVVLVMITASSAISVRKINRGKRAAFWKAVCALAVAGGVVLLFILYGVLRLYDPWYEPRIAIPLAGMIFSNAMTAITLASERLEREQSSGETYKNARAAAWTAALIPQVNALLAVGIVSLPGMMTGQILAGVDPLVAVRYQIVVMAMILQSAGFAVALFLYFAESSYGEATSDSVAN